MCLWLYFENILSTLLDYSRSIRDFTISFEVAERWQSQLTENEKQTTQTSASVTRGAEKWSSPLRSIGNILGHLLALFLSYSAVSKDRLNIPLRNGAYRSSYSVLQTKGWSWLLHASRYILLWLQLQRQLWSWWWQRRYSKIKQ